MANKSSIKENEIIKTFKFKTKIGKDDIENLWKPAMAEQVEYYNRLSSWLTPLLTTMTFGQLAAYVDEKKRKNTYYTDAISPEKKDKFIYEDIKSKTFQNCLYIMVQKLNPENYTGNILGFNETDYRRFGYFMALVSNLRTKLSKIELGIKYAKFDPENVDEETLKNQTILEIERNRFENATDFKNKIEALRSREDNEKNRLAIARFERLLEYYSEHDELGAEISRLKVEKLQEFGGCTRKSPTTLAITNQNTTIEKDGICDFVFGMFINKKPFTFGFHGNRQVVRLAGGKREDVIDLTTQHGENISFTLYKGDVYIHITKRVEFEKNHVEQKNVVGIDVNIKHMLLAVSEPDDGRLKGYVNLYKELMNDSGFVSTLSPEELKDYTDISSFVTFGPIETDSLFERYSDQLGLGTTDRRLIDREKAMEKVFDRIASETKDVHIRNYINYVKLFRAKCKAYAVLKDTYHRKQSEYDLARPAGEESPVFSTTETAGEILRKLDRTESVIIGCRDNIITYAFKTLTGNGIDTIGLEYLDSSQMKQRNLPSPKSMLGWHKLEGKTRQEVEKFLGDRRVSESNYSLTYDEAGGLTSVEFSPKGMKAQTKNMFRNKVIKAVHFADVKGKFAQLANNNSTNIIFVPAAFTSQMDSKRHKLYLVKTVVKDKKGKETVKYVIPDSSRVRKTQERHINGLNSDFNSASNIKYVIVDPRLLEMMTIITPDGTGMYSTPFRTVRKSFKKNPSAATLNVLMKNGYTVKGEIGADGLFAETEI